jgi:hypothetical protein
MKFLIWLMLLPLLNTELAIATPVDHPVEAYAET